MQVTLDALSWVCLVGGSVFSVIGGIGIVRFPDFFSRMHAGGITDTLGATLVLLGLMLQSGAGLLTVKLVMILLLLLVTSPTSGHALAQAALAGGEKPWTVDGSGKEDRSSQS